MPLLAAYAHPRGAPRLLVAALLFGWGGDVLLLSDADPAFLVGMGSFAAGHVCYLALFGRHRAHARGALLARRAAYGARPGRRRRPAVARPPRRPARPGRRLQPAADRHGLPVQRRLGLVAGARRRALPALRHPDRHRRRDWPQLPRPDFWIMLTYLAAQYLLVRGLGTKACAPPPGVR